ncbi:siderophore-interacting protein [Leucobacter sp. M11]|uniref:siderophore-interacting protein n=1 Tax=Leucobacter sp. M11 TaxID=2993565 RepID=UPI002D7E5263|nr:siderophore-interacting protein [Leucobacter sp. M11]MEB4613650.1 siderophore-interacting protein [Leucobacter sp. M11]
MITRTATPPRAPRRAAVLREVAVTAREQISERMLRVTLGGHDLAPTVHDAPGAWVKLFVPLPGGAGEHGRAYTVRGFDPIRDEITVDIFLHDGGTMTAWALGCRVGSPARIGGPRPSGAPGASAASLLLFGDETALPAISAMLEREHRERPAHAIVELGSPGDQQELELPPKASITWLLRGRTDAPGSLLVAAAPRARLDPNTGVWFAAEAHAAQEFRRLLRPVQLSESHTQGYWRRGVGDHQE